VKKLGSVTRVPLLAERDFVAPASSARSGTSRVVGWRGRGSGARCACAAVQGLGLGLGRFSFVFYRLIGSNSF